MNDFLTIPNHSFFFLRIYSVIFDKKSTKKNEGYNSLKTVRAMILNNQRSTSSLTFLTPSTASDA